MDTIEQQPAGPAYALTFDVDYPDRPLDRLTSAFRIFMLIPIVIVLTTLGTVSVSGDDYTGFVVSGGGLLFLPPLLMIVFRRKYPGWWFDWNRELLRFSNRVYAYGALLSDKYPSTDEQQYVKLELEYPNVREDLNRWLPLVKWFLAIPHYVVLFFLYVGAVFAVIAAWFAILFTGRYPRGLFAYVVGVMRWSNRVSAYAFVLATDEYPPFRLAN
ncbi:MAG: hypothetical protein QOJ22_1231 [Thermoleophilaceae bacterium]|jgi:hypothetical protein|nr:hypothetical protein [Thermoleophilaceae bacterium]